MAIENQTVQPTQRHNKADFVEKKLQYRPHASDSHTSNVTGTLSKISHQAGASEFYV